MSALEINYNYNGADYPLGVNYRNVIGSPVISASAIEALTSGSFCPLAGVFRFTMQWTTLVSVVAVHAEDIKSPSLYSGNKTVVADGVTINSSVLPGIALVLSDDAVYGDVFEIGIGCFYDSASSLWVRILPLGLAFANMTPVERTLRLTNTTVNVHCKVTIVATNQIRCVNATYLDRPFKCFRQTGSFNPVAHTTSSGKVVTFTSFATGSPNTASILVDGSALDVFDVTNDTLIASGLNLKCDGSTVYRFADGTDYQTGEFVLSSSLVSTDQATLYVSGGGSFVEISDGTNDFVPGTTGIAVTSENAPDGVVDSDSYVDFKIRLSNPGTSDLTLTPRLFSLRVSSEGV